MENRHFVNLYLLEICRMRSILDRIPSYFGQPRHLEFENFFKISRNGSTTKFFQILNPLNLKLTILFYAFWSFIEISKLTPDAAKILASIDSSNEFRFQPFDKLKRPF